MLCIEEAKAGLGGARAGRGAEAHPLQEPQLPLGHVGEQAGWRQRGVLRRTSRPHTSEVFCCRARSGSFVCSNVVFSGCPNLL